MIKNPVISVIMPVYNVEAYLKDAIESVINQTIGFEENIELILVNDGSKDSSGDICSEYARKYPNNVLYIKQKNQGLSATRYNGFLKARGTYIHSLDSDDTISKNYYKEAVKFFDKYGDRVDIVASKLMLFEARIGDHYLNYRFKKTRVIDINEEPDAFQYHIASCVIKRQAVKKEWFDREISIAEDARLIAIILYQKKAYGVVSNITYNYRIRSAGGSLINTQHEKRDFYLETPKRFWQYVIDLWKSDDGKIPLFIQKFILNDIQWRLNEQKSQKVLNKDEEQAYKDTVYGIVSQFDDDVILGQEKLNFDKKIFLLKKKYDTSFYEHLNFINGRYRLGDTALLDLSNKNNPFGFVFDFIHTKENNTYFIEGYPTNDRIHPDDQLLIKTSKGEYSVKYVERVQRRKDSFLGDMFHQEEAFEATIKVGEEDKIIGLLRTFSGEEVEIPIVAKRHTKLSTLNHSYRISDGRIFRKSNHIIFVKLYSRALHLKYEVLFWFQILKNIRLLDAYRLLREAVDQYRYWRAGYYIENAGEVAVSLLKPFIFPLRNICLNIMSIGLRVAYYFTLHKYSDTKPVWIITDRGIGAGDNGEAFFKYLTSLDEVPVEYYFAISKKSPDFKRLQKLGPVVDINSLKYELLFLHASKIISSQADEYIINPFGLRQPHLLDLFRFDFVFLQHGVTKNDISDWLNRFFKNIKLFVTVSEREHNSIIAYPFYYSSQKVLLSGFPRYDQLVSEPKGKIILAPTWRKYLTNGKIGKDGGWQYQDRFKQSDYYTFYNSLMNDPRILQAFKTSGVTGEFYLHPSHAAHIKDFQGNKYFRIKDFPYDYATAFREGNLLVTDYSSVYFDFSYLNKPVIYTQFDREFYYENHGVYEKGYFDERRDGFGPVLEDYESTVATIIEAVQNNFKLDKKYQKRIGTFFTYHDRNNSQRVYEAILRREKGRRTE